LPTNGTKLGGDKNGSSNQSPKNKNLIDSSIDTT